MSWSPSLLAGRWRLGPRLGSGGQGKTFLARDEKAQGPGERLVAVKELRLGEAGWKKFDLFEREARVLAKLEHPAIPRYLDRVEGEGGLFYLVMEKAPGDSLAGKRLDDAALRDVTAQLLDVLEYLHGRNPPVVHRDLKPANLLRDEKGHISLVDFGGVRDVVRDEGGSTVIGTFGYMAPEQLHGEATPRTDLYGLGATLVALAGGVEPEKVPRKGLKIDVKRALPRLAGDLRGLIERLVDPDPEKRPASVAEVRKLLKDAPKSVARVEQPEPEPEPEPEPDGGDWVRELDELSLPAPIKFILRMAFGMVGVAGHLALSLVALVIVPLGFALARGLSGRERDERLRVAERRVKGVLGDTRRDFRALQRKAFRPSPRLPPAAQPGRLRGRRR